MTKDDTPSPNAPDLAHVQDIPAAVGLLTRLPIRVDTGSAMKRGAAAAWCWPLVGIIPATLGAMVGFAALACNVPAMFCAALAVLVQVMITGAMHEDGLADTADGLWGGMTRARRLEIMKDSHIGAYGVIAIVLALILRVAAMSVILPAQGAFAALLVTAVVSRAPMVTIMAMLPNARKSGLAQSVGAVPHNTALLALGCTALITLVLTPYAVVALFFWTVLAALLVAGIAQNKIGGQTGDILGASQQVTEIAALAVFAALLA